VEVRLFLLISSQGLRLSNVLTSRYYVIACLSSQFFYVLYSFYGEVYYPIFLTGDSELGEVENTFVFS